MARNKTIETSGKTVDLAVEKALEELNVSKKEVEIEVLDEGEIGGLLGFGRRPAQVRVSLNSSLPSSDVDELEETDELDETDDESDQDEVLEYDETEREEGKIPLNVVSQQRKCSAGLFQDVLSGIGIHGRIDSYVDEEGSLHIDVSGSDSGAAIGRHGETLEALQYLANVVANKYVDDYLRVVVDVAGYRKRSEERNRDLANRTADKVMATGREMKLKPMNPAERRLVHMCLREYPGIVTYSEGRDPRRHIVVAPSAGVEVINDKGN